MNVTELARRLRVTPQELRNKLPLFGFDIGGKAIKVDNATAQKIIQNWARLMDSMRDKERAEKELAIKLQTPIRIVEIPNFISVRDFAALANIPVSKVIAELMKNSIFVSLNEEIDFDTAAIIGSDLGLEIKLVSSENDTEESSKNIIAEEMQKQTKEQLEPRPPIIVVMGHVDHGKTKLLDAIRRTSVAEGEAGGITQHIGAYQVVRRNRLITFIDTPGHEAFTAMRGRGAKVADIAILVVAADDGVKPQTVEAYRIIESAKLPYIVAINKVDKPEANVDKTRQELSNQLGIMPEDWGGKIICAPVSAKEGTGVEELLDMVLLTADMEAENIQANPKTFAVGTIIESRIDKGEGAVATMLVQNGTLKVGDKLTLGPTLIGRVRGLKNYRGEKIDEALPSTPAKIIGLKLAPEVGDIIKVGDGIAMDFKKFQTRKLKYETQTEKGKEDDKTIKKINIIIKSDVLGSGEAIQESLEKINTAEVKAEIISKGLGNVTDGDVRSAEASHALVVGFNVKVPVSVEESAREKRVEIKQYSIIYDLIDEIKKRMENLLEPDITRKDLGRLKILAVFKTDKNGQIVGGKVIDGSIEPNSPVEIFRGKEIIAKGKILQLKSGKEEVTIVDESQECGVQYEGEPVILAGDILQFYKEEKTVKKL